MRRKEYSCNATVAVVLVMLFITQIGGFYACIQQERQILLNFKRSLILSDDKEPLPSWEGDGDCCEWEGIACDNVTRHVVKIDLKNPCSVFFTVETSTEPQQPDNEFCLPADAFAEEDFSRHLSQLQHLTYLDLSGVAIQENPAFLGSMQRLRYLSLRVYYAPAASYTFPTGSIGNLTNLRALYLESLFFANVTDSSWLAPLSSLQYLGLKAVDLSMPQAHHLFKVLNTLPSLLHLHLPACSLGQVSSSLVSDPIFPLTNLTRLQLLNLAWNGLNQDSPVLHAFQNFTSIKVLDISRNFLSSVPSRLAKVHNLVKLDLSSNNITVLDPLKNLTSIRVLNLNENNLNSIVPFWLGKFKNLVRLDLSRNILYGPVPCALRNLTSLTFLNLSNNHLNSLPSCLAELKSLIHLGLSKNNFTTVEEGFLPSILNNLCHLQFLDLSQSNCQVLAFKDKGTLSSCDSHALGYLDLSKNKFGGLLPSWLGQFKNLKYLNLMSNSFSSPIPFSIRNLTKLTVLNLGDNMFDGLIPHSLAQLVNLQHLNLSSNHFGDAISQSMGRLKNLKSLDFSSNHFGGIIPQNLGQLKNLKSLDLSSNHFGGIIPQNLAATVVALVIAVLVAERHGRRRKRHPIAGTVFHQLVNFNRLHDYMTDLARKHSSYRLLSLSSSEVCTSDPTNVEYILKTNFSNYGKGRHQYEILRDLLGDGIFTVDGEKWRHQRKTASYQLSSKLSRDYSSSVFKSNAVKLAAIVSEEATSNKAIEIQDLLSKTTMDSVFNTNIHLPFPEPCQY
ncbi:hypothetical protein S83_053035 [Arachis hypogaea]